MDSCIHVRLLLLLEEHAQSSINLVTAIRCSGFCYVVVCNHHFHDKSSVHKSYTNRFPPSQGSVCFASLTFFDLPLLQHRLLTLILASLPSSYSGAVFAYAQHITQLGIGKASALRRLTSGFGKFLI